METRSEKHTKKVAYCSEDYNNYFSYHDAVEILDLAVQDIQEGIDRATVGQCTRVTL